MVRRVFLLVALFFPLAFGFSAGVGAQEATPTPGAEVVVLGPDESYGGNTRAEWDLQQWQMMMSFPADINPGFDTTGERCGYGQSGPVFLLPGSFSPEPREIICIVPQGMAIFVPLGAASCTTVDPPPYFGADEEELTACANEAIAPFLEVGVSINGQDVPDAMSYRTESSMGPLVFPENNVWEIDPVVASTVSVSYSIIIAPPEPGEYRIETTNVIDGLDEPFTGVFNVIVQEPQIYYPSEESIGSPEATPES